jgi:hypothetical protein
MSQLELNIRQKMQSETHGTIEGLQSIFNDIAKAIVRLGHGGLLLIVDEYKESYFSSFRQIDSPLLQQPLIQYWDSAADLSAVAGSPGKVLNRPDRSETYDGRTLIVAANVEMLEKYIRTVSHLASMDGAIVLDYRCKVVAFNAIIAKTEDRPQDYRFIAQDNVATKYEDVVNNKGSRHQSALSFVMRVPRSFAFVISQDSSISVFHNPDDGSIRCAQEMRVLDG